jgi:gas vesicle protein
MAERDEFGAFLIGFIIGGLTGAAISLLMAPQSGEDTREYLKDQAIVLRDKAQETAQTTAEQVNVRTADVRSRAGEIASKAKTSADDLRQRGQVALEEQRNRLQNLRGNKQQDEETSI